MATVKQSGKPIKKLSSRLETLKGLYKKIQETYLQDQRPWVIGYSGGKDSTTVLQLTWYAVQELPPKKRTKPIFVISSDTLVETPVIVSHINSTLSKINTHAKKKRLPFQAHKVIPKIDETFWVNLIGRGYPAPYTGFRWCTDRMKIQPANRFILEKIAQYGEAIVVLGSRRQESSTRAQVMNLHKIKGSSLSRHSSLPSAYCYTPIEDFSTDDVWVYLLQVPSPWGGNNNDLLTLYKSSQAGECPLVIDTSTPSCGNSRFGCWVCTVVEKDHTMEALIDSGETWMEPMLEFRNWLSSTQLPENKQKFRDFKGRNGRIRLTRDGQKIARGPYSFREDKHKEFDGKVRQYMFRRLLKIQEESQRTSNINITLIGLDEIREIRKLWMTEEQDWEDTASKIYREVTGRPLGFEKDDLVSFSSEDRELLDKVSSDEGVPPGLVAKLIEAERQLHGMGRRSSIYSRLDQIFKEEWRNEEEVLKDLNKNAPKEISSN